MVPSTGFQAADSRHYFTDIRGAGARLTGLVITTWGGSARKRLAMEHGEPILDIMV